MKKTFLILMAALAMVGCVKNELEAPVAPELGFEPEDLVATLEGGDTKTHIDSYGSVLWSEGDKITVLYSGTNLALTYVLKEDSINKTKGNFIYDSNSGWFSTTLPAIPGEATQKYDKFYGVYPPYGYTESRPVLLDKDGQLQVTIPATQHYTKLVNHQVSFDRDAAVMTGASGDINGIQFKNATGLLKVFLYLVDNAEDKNPIAKSGVPPINRVESITVSSTAHLLAGPAYINASAAAVIKEDGVHSATLRCYDADDNPIVLDASETYTTKGGVTFDGNAFILALPPTAFAAGEELELVIKMEDSSGAKSTLHKTITIPEKGFKILRSAISTIPVYYTLAEIEANIENRAAKIGDVTYETLAQAISAATSGQTISLIGDIEDNIVLPADKNLTLDLNGKTLNGKQTANSPSIKNEGTLTLTNGTIERSGEGSASYYVIENEGNLTLGAGMTVTGSASSSLIRNNAAEAVMTINAGTYTQTGAFIVLKNDLGTVVINGGEFTTAADKNVLNNWDTMTINGGTFNGCIFNGAYDTDDNVMTITDGTFNSELVRTYLGNGKHNAPINIAGGSFTNASLKFVGTAKTESDTDIQVNITAGSFKVDPSACVPEGFDVVDNGDGTWTVQKTVAAMVGGVSYANLADALAAVPANGTVSLVADVVGNIEVPADKNFTLDLNGKTLNGKQTANTPSIVNKGTLTLQNGTVQRSGEGSASYYVIENEGNLTLGAGMTVTGSANSSLIRNNAADAVMTINGGTYTQTGAFIVLKNDLGTVVINGGEFTTAADKNVLNNWNTMTINGGTFNGCIFNGAYDTDDNVMTITDGTFNSELVRTYLGNGKHNAPINIAGGSFTNASLKFVGTAKTESDTDIQVEITGGTFKVDPSKFVAASAAVIAKDGVYTVVGGGIKTALAQATSGSTVMLLSDCTESLTVGEGVTLDCKGYTVSNTVKVYSNATVKNATIRSGSCFDVARNGLAVSGVSFADVKFWCTAEWLFAINGGNTFSFNNCEFHGGMYWAYSDSDSNNLTFTNCKFVDLGNPGNGDKYGMYIGHANNSGDNSVGSVIFRHCEFEGGKIQLLHQNNIEYTNCKFKDSCIGMGLSAQTADGKASAVFNGNNLSGSAYLSYKYSFNTAEGTKYDISGNYWGGTAKSDVNYGCTKSGYEASEAVAARIVNTGDRSTANPNAGVPEQE